MRTGLQLALSSIWQHRGVAAWLLTPLSVLFIVGYQLRRALFALGLLHSTRIDAPVIVIGNLYVGGTGKTPLTLALVHALIERGWRPGIVSRGYGASASAPHLVQASDDPQHVGDEPLLMARQARVPVAIGARRAEAAQLLRRMSPTCDVIIADDGLQHRALARDMEIALLHHRGLGNGWMLPAGPLREPARRLDRVDAIVLNGDVPPIHSTTPSYRMRTRHPAAYSLHDSLRRVELSSLAGEQRASGLRVVAAAGIGAPERFFAMLRAAGLVIDELPLADHFAYRTNPFSGLDADRILITEKDAVKCASDAALRHDRRLWVVPLIADVDPELIDAVVARISSGKN